MGSVALHRFQLLPLLTWAHQRCTTEKKAKQAAAKEALQVMGDDKVSVSHKSVMIMSKVYPNAANNDSSPL